MKRELRLYNVLIPIWLLFIFPVIWLIILPANFIIDSAVLLISMVLLKDGADKWRRWIKHIWLIWIFGFLSDAVGGIFLFLLTQTDFLQPFGESVTQWWYTNVAMPVMMNPFNTVWGVLLCLISIAISALLIYIFNFHIALKKVFTDVSRRRKCALAFAVITAPWTYLLPSQWMWS